MTADWSQALEDAEVLLDAASSLSRGLADATPNDATLSEVARLHIVLQEAGEQLGQIISTLNGWAALMMEGDQVRLPGVGVLERGWSKSRTDWDNDSLRRDVVRAIRFDPETGEEIATDVVRELSDAYYLSGSNVRIKWLQSHGLHPGDYCHESPWRAKVKMTKERSDDSEEG